MLLPCHVTKKRRREASEEEDKTLTEGTLQKLKKSFDSAEGTQPEKTLGSEREMPTLMKQGPGALVKRMIGQGM